MEAAPGALAAERNGVVPPMSSSSSRKEWRIVSEQSGRNSGNQELEHTKLAQSEERLIYEVQNGREPLDVDFCSITIDGDLDNDILQQRLHSVSKQREELQSMEIEFRAQVIAKSEIVGLQNRFDAKLKDHSNATLKLQEQLHEKEHMIHELERRMDEKERELHAIRLDNQAVWAKEDLLREQSKELQSYMRERDNTEAERAQHIKQIHDLQEHIQEKESQFIELQEQHRIAQETIIFKDEQIREAQAWITRAQEIDALQSTTIHSLQAELRDRTEQYNQLWLVCQRQFGEMERLNLHIQQLQLEKSGSQPDGSHVSDANLNDASQVARANHSQVEVNDNNSVSANTVSIQNDNTETSGGNTSTQTDQVQGVAFAPSSLFGMPTYLPTALHPFIMHQQGVPLPSHVPQSHFHPFPAMSSIQNWQGQQQVLPDGEHVAIHDQYPEQAEGNLLRTDSQFEYNTSVNGQVLHANYLNSEASQGLDANSVVPSQNEEEQEVHNTIHKTHDNAEPQNLQQISSQFDDAHTLGSLEDDSETKEKKVNPVIEHSHFAISASSSEASIHAVNPSETESTNTSSGVLINAFVSTGQRTDVEKPKESFLMGERALLASIARTIGCGGRIKISSTLSNRLGRMIAPLHWHDYKRKYGKLDDFLASHPNLFLMEGDYIQLREGAQATIAATAAVAKVAAIGPSSYSSVMPSVSLTPMAQSHRLKKASSLESSSTVQNKNLDSGSGSDVQILSKTKDQVGSNVSETKSGQAPPLVAGTRTNSDRIVFPHNKGGSRGKPVGKKRSGQILGIMRNAVDMINMSSPRSWRR